MFSLASKTKPTRQAAAISGATRAFAIGLNCLGHQPQQMRMFILSPRKMWEGDNGFYLGSGGVDRR
jgi:hypothetical protein